jgi:hypothetical protein
MVTSKNEIIKSLMRDLKEAKRAAKSPKLPKVRKVKLKARMIVLRRTVKVLRQL